MTVCAAPATSPSPSSRPVAITALEAALMYVADGLPVFPCKLDKSPATAHGFLDATTEPEQIRALWRRWPAALVGVAIPSGLVVVDVDGPSGWRSLESNGLELPETLSAITGRGEWHRHLWYSVPRDLAVNCTRGLVPGVDLRARGGYVIAPPSESIHGRYRWVEEYDLSAVAPAPAWLLDRLRPTRNTGEARPTDEWTAMLRGPVPEGHRHETLLRVAGLLLRRHDPPIAVELARAWHEARCTPPLSEAEAARILGDALRLEARRRAGGAR